MGAHFLDLGGLLSELGCESLYLFLLLRDRHLLLRDGCLQALNFVIEHGLVRGLGAHARLRCVTMRRSRCATTPASASVIAKVVVIKVQSNYNNVAANRLGVVEDTTDVALQGPGPVPVREVADADGTVFVVGFGTNEVADVSVIEAIGQVCSCHCTHGCVLTTINVIEERLSANCRVVIGIAVSSRVIILEREITNGGILSAMLISEERGIAHGIVTESVLVILERRGTESTVEFAGVVR